MQIKWLVSIWKTTLGRNEFINQANGRIIKYSKYNCHLSLKDSYSNFHRYCCYSVLARSIINFFILWCLQCLKKHRPGIGEDTTLKIQAITWNHIRCFYDVAVIRTNYTNCRTNLVPRAIVCLSLMAKRCSRGEFAILRPLNNSNLVNHLRKCNFLLLS